MSIPKLKDRINIPVITPNNEPSPPHVLKYPVKDRYLRAVSKIVNHRPVRKKPMDDYYKINMAKFPQDIENMIKYLASDINVLIKTNGNDGFIPTLKKLIQYKNPITIYVDQTVYKIPEDKGKIPEGKIPGGLENSNNLYFTKVNLTLDKPINEVHVYLKADYIEEGGLTLPVMPVEDDRGRPIVANYYFYGDSTTFPVIANNNIPLASEIMVDLSGLKKVTGEELKTKLFSIRNNLIQIRLPENITSLKWRTFEDYKSLTAVTLPTSVTSLGESCFEGCASLETINLENVKELGESCFRFCESLTTVTLPNSVTSLGKYCFSSCKSLENVTIPNSVTTLGDYCFYGCGLTNITIPNSVTSLGEKCFYTCSNLTNIILPNSVTSLGEKCFYTCSNLTNITLPASIILGKDCFYGCGLTTVNYTGELTDEFKKHFENLPGIIFAPKTEEEKAEGGRMNLTIQRSGKNSTNKTKKKSLKKIGKNSIKKSAKKTGKKSIKKSAKKSAKKTGKKSMKKSAKN